MDSHGVFLSFDDGPGEGTEAILDLLDREKTRAIFFLVGDEAKKRPELVREIVARGHAPGLHAGRHRRPWEEFPWRRWAQMEEGLQVLRQFSEVRYFRPPHGLYTLADVVVMKRHGLLPVHWESLVGDWEKPGVEELTKRLDRAYDRGGVVVLHDGSLGAAVRDACTEIAPALSRVMDRRREEVISWRENLG